MDSPKDTGRNVSVTIIMVDMYTDYINRITRIQYLDISFPPPPPSPVSPVESFRRRIFKFVQRCLRLE